MCEKDFHNGSHNAWERDAFRTSTFRKEHRRRPSRLQSTIFLLIALSGCDFVYHTWCFFNFFYHKPLISWLIVHLNFLTKLAAITLSISKYQNSIKIGFFSSTYPPNAYIISSTTTNEWSYLGKFILAIKWFRCPSGFVGMKHSQCDHISSSLLL